MKYLQIIGLLFLASFQLTSCDNTVVEEPAVLQEIVGDWEMYRFERLEQLPDKWTGTTWTYKDKWYSYRHNGNSKISFLEDGTFLSFYATTKIGNGVWETVAPGIYSITYSENHTGNNAGLTATVSLSCENSYSSTLDGNDRLVEYMRKLDTVECTDDITYNVD